ncbi:hypothetical protein CLF_109646 [Clonorchis sinensis]|uniref:Uncharacterized protein n=1 Tax=Clonorchis sinensis TaxID=79923 RepID=G7YJM3_CLOSI|nr:hypothetical protein CLF_109646 [Clonorchis sinensis]
MRTDAKKDLGIRLSTDVSLSVYHEKSPQKAFAVLRMIRHTFSRIIRMNFQILYGTYVRPLLEYANQVVHSGRKRDVTLIGRVQRATMKMGAGLKSQCLDSSPGVSSLPRRTITYLTLCEQGLASIFFTVDAADTRQGHGERQPLNNKNNTDPGNLGEDLDQSVGTVKTTTYGRVFDTATLSTVVGAQQNQQRRETLVPVTQSRFVGAHQQLVFTQKTHGVGPFGGYDTPGERGEAKDERLIMDAVFLDSNRVPHAPLLESKGKFYARIRHSFQIEDYE